MVNGFDDWHGLRVTERLWGLVSAVFPYAKLLHFHKGGGLLCLRFKLKTYLFNMIPVANGFLIIPVLLWIQTGSWDL